jgi:very-short-patch-repair endonuclease
MQAGKFPYYYNAPQSTIEKAKILRLNLTLAEKIIWNVIRDRKIEGCKFRRQHPIGPYISDFYAHEIKLVIEADGGIHNTKDHKEYDGIRDEFFSDREITILRLPNYDIENKLAVVVEKIRKTVIDLTLLKTSPSVPLL